MTLPTPGPNDPTKVASRSAPQQRLASAERGTADRWIACRKPIVQLASILLIALLIFDLWALYPFFNVEFSRLEPWKAVLCSVGDSISLLWLFKFVTQQVLLAQPLIDRRRGPGETRGIGWFYISLIVGLGADLAATLYFGHAERIEYEHAVQSSAKVVGITTRHSSDDFNWEFITQFSDASARQFQTVVRLHLNVDEPFPSALSASAVAALKSGASPPAIPLRYHAAWPMRAWIDGVPEDENGLMWFSLCMIVFQAATTCLVALACRTSYRTADRNGVIPWWLNAHRVVPAALQIVVMAPLGFLVRWG